MKNNIQGIREYLLSLQSSICDVLGDIDSKKNFIVDPWTRPEGADGITRVLEDGAVFERAGVNFSHITGDTLPQAATAKNPGLVGGAFEALGVSLVIHPQNPYIPTTHANIRFFVAHKPDGESVWWFGGGVDLTPYYPFLEDCEHWHRVCKKACDPFGDDVYAQYKKACDDYFYLPHRGETRGVGGLFFDDLNEWGFEKSFAFLRAVGDSLLKGYVPIVNARKDLEFTKAQRAFQLYRRGRYVEFNLLYDRGTKFGVQFGGRIESILVSLPREVHWTYNYKPEPGTPEAQLTDEFLRPRDWLVNEKEPAS